jgi:hypothetical protein
MALSEASLKTKIDAALTEQGFVVGGEFAMASKLATAIAKAVVEEITQNAVVNVNKVT